MARNEQALRDVVQQSAAVLTAAGFPKMPARVLLALTVAEDGGLTAQELSESLGVSAAAISGAVRYLQSLGFVRRLAQAGSRRDRYELPEDAWLSVFSQERPIYRALAGLADAGVAAIDDSDSTPSLRLDEMAQFYRFLDARLPELMGEWAAQRSDSRIPSSRA